MLIHCFRLIEVSPFKCEVFFFSAPDGRHGDTNNRTNIKSGRSHVTDIIFCLLHGAAVQTCGGTMSVDGSSISFSCLLLLLQGEREHKELEVGGGAGSP